MMSIRQLIADHRPFHCEFQIDALIIARAGGTAFGAYLQSVRELWKRLRGLIDAYLQEVAIGFELERLTRVCDESTVNDDLRRIQQAAALEEIRLTRADTEREFLRFYGQAAALKEHLGELTPERRRQLDEDLWEHRLKCHAAVDFLSQGRLSAGTVEFLQACPIAMRRRVAALVLNPERHSELVDWYLNYDPELPAPLEIDRRELPRLLAGTPLAPLLTESFAGRLGLPGAPRGDQAAERALP